MGPSNADHRPVCLQGQLRLLHYAADSETLFFTTTLQDSVQSYSLKQAKLLDPTHTHPSPPNVFALSSGSRLLISASATPPTVHLTNLALNSLPVLLRPDCSDSAVVAAAFHPNRPTIFLLGFADGTLAAYNAVCYFQDGGKSDRKAGPAGTGKGGEMNHLKKLHAVGTTAFPDPEISRNFGGYDCGTQTVNVGDQGTGITSVAFVPGLNGTAVSVGADGKCCVVEFDGHVRGGARILTAWYAPISVTSLSILAERSGIAGHQIDHAASLETDKAITQSVLVAIGCHDGRVMLYNLCGKFLGEQVFDTEGAQVIDVEWLEDEAVGKWFRHESIEAKSLKTFSRPTANHTNVNRARDKHLRDMVVSSNGASPPKIPPRPIPRVGGKLALHRAETARLTLGVAFDAKQDCKSYSRKNEPIEPAIVASSTRSRQENCDNSPAAIPNLDGSLSGMPEAYKAWGPGQVEDSFTGAAAIPMQVSRRGSSFISSPDRKKPSLHPVLSSMSEASNDTVIDWSAGVGKPITLHQSIPVSEGYARDETQSSGLVDSMSLYHSVKSDDTIIDWSLPRSPAKLDLHEDLQEQAGNKAPLKRQFSALGNGSLVARVLSPTSLDSRSSIVILPNSKAKRVVDHERSCACCQKHALLQAEAAKAQISFQYEIRTFQDKLMQQFQEQKKWMKEAVLDQEEWRMKLEEENRLLRQELARERRHAAR